MLYRIIQIIGKLALKCKQIKKKILIHIAQNWCEPILINFTNPYPVLQAVQVSGNAVDNQTHSLALMIKSGISYTDLRSWFYKNCKDFKQNQDRDYYIEITYYSEHAHAKDFQVCKLRIDFIHNAVHKFSDNQWITEEIVFNNISLKPAARERLKEHNSDNFLKELESLTEFQPNV